MSEATISETSARSHDERLAEAFTEVGKDMSPDEVEWMLPLFEEAIDRVGDSLTLGDRPEPVRRSSDESGVTEADQDALRAP